MPPSQGLMGPLVEAAIQQLDQTLGPARLVFGPDHEVTCLLTEVTDALHYVAQRGVIHSQMDGPSPRDYVAKTLQPLVLDLFEALARACELRSRRDRVSSTGTRAGDNLPSAFQAGIRR